MFRATTGVGGRCFEQQCHKRGAWVLVILGLLDLIVAQRARRRRAGEQLRELERAKLRGEPPIGGRSALAPSRR